MRYKQQTGKTFIANVIAKDFSGVLQSACTCS